MVQCWYTVQPRQFELIKVLVYSDNQIVRFTKFKTKIRSFSETIYS
jgi:hypothetical protein